jgi:hypothetical protein
MGQTAAAAVTEIEQTRRRLDTELRELETYLPAAALWAKRVVGALAAGGVATTLLLTLVRMRRRREEGRPLRELEHRLDRVEREIHGLTS